MEADTGSGAGMVAKGHMENVMVVDGEWCDAEMEAASGNGCRTAVEVKGEMREKSGHSGPVWVRDCVSRALGLLQK